jgi:hypothetical protein
MRFGRMALLAVGIALITVAIYWWVRLHRVPTLRFTFVVGKGASVDLDWIDLKPGVSDSSLSGL